MESECPATTAPVEPAATVIFDGRVDSLILDGGEKPPGDGGGGPQIAIDPAKPGSEFTAETLVIQTPAPGHFPLLERIRVPTHPEMDPSHLAALEAAKELAGENATLKAQIKEIRDLLGCDGRPEDALCHLSDVLVDAGAPIPDCDRSPNCKSLHLSTRIHDLADERDMYKHSHDAAAQQHSRLCKAFGLESADPEMLEQVILTSAKRIDELSGVVFMLDKTPFPVGKDGTAKALGELLEHYTETSRQLEVARFQLRESEANHRATRRFLESERKRANAAEDELAEISWLCTSYGYTGSGDTVEMLCWLLAEIGQMRLVTALAERRRLLGEIREREIRLKLLTSGLRSTPPETSDRCQCGGEARKVEGEDGFTECDNCFYRDLGVDSGEGAE